MGAGIAATNAAAIAARLRDVRAVIDRLARRSRARRRPDDAALLEPRFAAARERLVESDAR